MKIILATGIFFLVLATAFTIAGWRNDQAFGESRNLASRSYRRVAVVFALVGLGLVLLQLFR